MDYRSCESRHDRAGISKLLTKIGTCWIKISSCQLLAVGDLCRGSLLSPLAEKPDLTLRALESELEEREVKTSYASVWRILKDEGSASKKTLHASE